jgi:hypothetical protein
VWAGATGAEPQVFWASDPVGPNETVLLQGSGFSDKAIVEVARLDDGPVSAPVARAEPKAWTRATVLQAGDVSLKFVVPTDWKLGVMACRVVVDGAVSPTTYLNAPDPWWVQGDAGETATPDGWLRVLGKCLNFGGHSAGRLEGDGGASLALAPASADGYSLRFALPDTLQPGAYRVLVHNGLGGNAAWREAGTLKIQTPSWPTSVYSVLEPYGKDAAVEMRKTLVKYSDVKDRTEGIQAALKKAKENGGGVVYFPAGRYGVTGEISVPSRTVLRGEGTGLVVLWWGTGRFNLDGGNAKGLEHDENTPKPPGNLISGRDFAVEDMSLYLPREYQTAIAAWENVRMRRLLIRIDHGWTLHTKRYEGCVVRMGKNCEVSDCDILAKGTGLIPGTFCYVARNRVMAGKTNCPLGGAQQVIVEENHFVSTHPTAYMNIAGRGRNLYYAHNRMEALQVHQADFSFTFDAGGAAYFGKVAEVAGTHLTLAADPTYPKWAQEKDSLWKNAVVCILDGTGAGQYRNVTANQGRAWEVDRAWDCPPDKASMITIVPFNGRALVIENQFEDANWINAGFGTSIEVLYAKNRLVRCAQLLNYGLAQKGEFQPSWYVQYLNNELSQGHTSVDTLGHVKERDVYSGAITRCTIHRCNTLSPDNSGGVHIGGGARDVIVEGCTVGHPMGTIRVDDEAQGILFRNNTFTGEPSPRYEGKHLQAAGIPPTQTEPGKQ